MEKHAYLLGWGREREQKVPEHQLRVMGPQVSQGLCCTTKMVRTWMALRREPSFVSILQNVALLQEVLRINKEACFS